MELGFNITWGGDYIGFERDGCKFILQKFDNKLFAENFMISVAINNAEEFWSDVNENNYLENLVFALESQLNYFYGRRSEHH